MLAFRHLPEHVRLMLLAARARPSPAELQQMQELVNGPMDWPAFLSVTLHHRLGPLVFVGLERLGQLRIPPDVQDALKREARINALEAIHLSQEVGRIAEHAAEAGIFFSTLKGLALSQLLFDNPNARHVGDIDLLIDLKDLPKQVELLKELGYRRTNPACALTPLRMASYVKYWKDFSFANDVADCELDLHWRLFNNRFHPANRLLEDAEQSSVLVFGVPMRVFSPSDQFLYITAHGSSDAWLYLKTLADVAAFLRLFTAQDLERVLLRAKKLGLLAQVSAAIHLANDWMGAGITSSHLLAADHTLARRIRERTSTMLLRYNYEPQRIHPSSAQWLRLELQLVPGLRSLAELARRYLWRPRVWASVNLPDRLFWLYPLLSLLLLPRRHSPKD